MAFKKNMAACSSPKFLKPISARTLGQFGGRALLEAVVVGRPVPVITWHKNGLPVTKDERHVIRYEERGLCCLTLLNVVGEDEGEYECRAKNRLGQVSCFGQFYVSDSHGLESGVKQMGLRQQSSQSSARNETQPAATAIEDGNDESEGHSGLFILIDEGSQDENSADEMGKKESISASEQIESIIEDLRLRDGSLNFSLAKQGSSSEQQKRYLHHYSPSFRDSSSSSSSSSFSRDQPPQHQRTSSSSTSTTGGNKPYNFKHNRLFCLFLCFNAKPIPPMKGLIEKGINPLKRNEDDAEQRKRFLNQPELEYEDGVVLGEDIPITSRGRKSPKCLARNSNPMRPRVAIPPLHKVVGVENNLHQFEDNTGDGSSTSDSTEANLHFAPLAEYEMIRSANISADTFKFNPHSFNSYDLDEDEIVNISPPPEFQTKIKTERRNLSEGFSGRRNKKMNSRQRSGSDCLSKLNKGNDDSASSPWEESSEEVFEESLELESSVEEVFQVLNLEQDETEKAPNPVEEVKS
ncbi:hypothetical protein CHUAL_007737 [Chamberlinius hualienensis]